MKSKGSKYTPFQGGKHEKTFTPKPGTTNASHLLQVMKDSLGKNKSKGKKK